MKLFCKLGYDSATAKMMAQAHCYQGHLTQGNPAAPLIASLAIRGVDTAIRSLLKATEQGEEGFTTHTSYSRYADDLTITVAVKECEPKKMKGRVQQLLNSTLRILKLTGNVSFERTKVHCISPKSKRAREIVGVKVVPTTKGFRLQPPRKTNRRERASKHWSKKHDLWLPTDQQHATGDMPKMWSFMVKGYAANRTAVERTNTYIMKKHPNGYYATRNERFSKALLEANKRLFLSARHIQIGYGGVLLKQ